MWAWFIHFMGSDYGAPYGHFVPNAFWSGFGSDITEFGIPVALYGAWYKHNCHTKGCWRIGKHTVDGTPWCNKHHTDAREANLRKGE